ncbi:unnamed protein product [Notodromas monacha]|uniref:Peptidase M14 domain-containing protein n=1 Tax=Notodromas monacha TaxID=399045 RepID=A0A7R9BZT5_9CRUS|nr:unnamed protein product [Notodromas monacha]CAG0923599.1 unnamed protein product [Notodromas monacha]
MMTGMQDFAYLSTNDMEVTLELGCDKYPPAGALAGEWADNKDALVNFIKMAHMGVKGVVKDARSGLAIRGALIKTRNVTSVNGGEDALASADGAINHDVTSGKHGDYFRLLTPGQYELTAVASGYMALSQVADVGPVDPTQPEATKMDFWLTPSENYPSDDEPMDQQMVDDNQEAEALEPEERLIKRYRDFLMKRAKIPNWLNPRY